VTALRMGIPGWARPLIWVGGLVLATACGPEAPTSSEGIPYATPFAGEPTAVGGAFLQARELGGRFLVADVVGVGSNRPYVLELDGRQVTFPQGEEIVFRVVAGEKPGSVGRRLVARGPGRHMCANPEGNRQLCATFLFNEPMATGERWQLAIAPQQGVNRGTVAIGAGRRLAPGSNADDAQRDLMSLIATAAPAPGAQRPAVPFR
jgi:hypothetical protein